MGPWGPVPHTLGRGLVSWPSLNPQCPGCRHSHGGGFNRPCHLLGRGGPWARSRGRQGAVLSAHTAPPWPLHTPGVTVDLDDLPGLVGSLVVHTRAVLLGHAASAPIGQQPHRADTARHAVSAELWTGGCRQQSLWPGSGMPPTRAPRQHSHALQADSHSPRPGCGSFERTRPPVHPRRRCCSQGTP